MRINHNISALNTYRQLTLNTTAGSKSLEKLSSGYRINRAGDDAAGLAISEKMRGQIRGLEMAQKNAQDGISLIQTAEGALNETHSILQRMRELAVQASNETNTGDDRKELQKEIEQLKSEIDRISDTTEFNTKKLLNGGLGAVGTSTDSSKIAVVSASGLKAGDYDIEITTAATQATLTGGVAVADDSVAAGLGLDNTTEVYINGTKIDFTGAETKAEILSAINAKSDVTGVTASWDTSNNLVLTSEEYGEGQTITVSGADAATLFGASPTFVDGVNAVATVDVKDSAGNVVETYAGIEGQGRNLVFQGAEFELKGAATDKETITVSQVGARLQIGANSEQEMVIDVSEMSTKTLGNSNNKIKDVNILTTDGAQTAITTIDDAIKQVSAERSKLGAFQNRLEHTINNLGASAENLTAAESRIRDVDMAKEMMEFTKQNILTQAAQAMLAQANQQPQGVLQLLR